MSIIPFVPYIPHGSGGANLSYRESGELILAAVAYITWAGIWVSKTTMTKNEGFGLFMVALPWIVLGIWLVILG